MKFLLSIIVLLGLHSHLFAQSVGINDDGSSPDPSAILDVKSSDKGLLIPRVDTSAIINPTAGMMVFQPVNNGFYFYNGVIWQFLGEVPSVLADADQDTKVDVEHTSDVDEILFSIAGVEKFKMDSSTFHFINMGNNTFIGGSAGENNSSGSENTFVGGNAGKSNTSGDENVFIGYNAGRNNTSGHFNSFFGMQVGMSNTSGHFNSFYGSNAGMSNTIGDLNSFFGRRAGMNNTTGIKNSFFGSDAGMSNTSGRYNSFFGTDAGLNNTIGIGNSFFGRAAGRSNIDGHGNAIFGRDAGENNSKGDFNSFFGRSAGKDNTRGNQNSYIGHGAGENNLGSSNVFIGAHSGKGFTNLDSSLIIDIEENPNPLIYGNFNEDYLRFNGDLQITDTLQISLGANNGYIPVSNDVGVMTWTDPDSISFKNDLIADADEDTKISVEKTSDQDEVIVTIDGVDILKIDSMAINFMNTNDNTLVGNYAGSNITTGSQNSLYGRDAGRYLTTGQHNTAAGYRAMRSMKTGLRNIAIGFKALEMDTSNQDNIVIGHEAGKSLFTKRNVVMGTRALEENFSGGENVAIGFQANRMLDVGIGNTALGYNNLSFLENGNFNSSIGNSALIHLEEGYNNVAIGWRTAFFLKAGNDNVFIGKEAGPEIFDTIDNRLFLDNEPNSNPLIYGEFDNDMIRINGDFEVTDDLQVDENAVVKGNLHIDGNLNVLGTIPTTTIIEDVDQDTKIEVEKHPDEDRIRFTVQGSEMMHIKSQRITIADSLVLSQNAEDGYMAISDSFGHLKWTDPSLVSTKALASIEDADQDTKIEVEKSTDNNEVIISIAGSERYKIDSSTIHFLNNLDNIFIGEEAGQNTFAGASNVFMGSRSGKLNSSGGENAFFGYETGMSNTNGSNNSFFGSYAGRDNTTSDGNSFFGYEAGRKNTTGNANSFFGLKAGDKNEVGYANTFIGYRSGEDNNSGIGNTYIGFHSGQTVTGDYNVFIGHQSGNVYGSSDSLLAIDSRLTPTPLIYGEFNNNMVRINGDLEVTGCTPSTSTVEDKDEDTRLEIEQTPDVDEIVITIDGVEKFKIDSSTIHFINTNNNTYVGRFAGEETTTGGENTYIGRSSGRMTTSGTENTMLGFAAGLDNEEGSNNTFVGAHAGEDNTDGIENVYIGHDAGAFTKGSGNVFIGNRSGLMYQNSDDLLIIDNSDTVAPLIYGEFDNDFLKINGDMEVKGFESKLASGHNYNIIKTGTATQAANQYTNTSTSWTVGTRASDSSFVINNGLDLFSSYLIVEKGGNVGFGINNPSKAIVVNGGAHCSGTAWFDASDRRLKKDITPIEYGLPEIMLLNPVHYTIKKDDQKDIGFIAQEVQKVIPEVVTGFEGDLEQGENLGMSYGHLTALIVKGMQEMYQEMSMNNDNLENEIEKLKTQNELLLSQNKLLMKHLESSELNHDSTIENNYGIEK